MSTMHAAKVAASMTLIRTPMLSQVTQVVALSNVSFNTELNVIHQLSAAAQKANCVHGVVLMVELGDLREGIMPVMLERVAERIPMPDYMQEQMPEMMPKVMDNLMPHMIGDVVPLVTKPMINYLRGK